MAKLMSRLAVSHFFSLTDEAKRFVLSMLKNYDKPFMEICEAADVAPLTGGRIINGRPFNRDSMQRWTSLNKCWNTSKD